MNSCGRFLLGMSVLFTPAAPAAESPLFSRHVEAVFSRLGCNGGTCHGAVQGQGGLRLSLFGADPAGDHERLLHDSGGRRLHVLDPDASLLLLKGTARVPHGGGLRLVPGSAEYDLLRRWIAAGAPGDDPARSMVRQIRVAPASHTARPGTRYQLRVEATFADGQVEDVTQWCSFESRDPAVATVSRDGQVVARSPGGTALITRYRSEPALALLAVPQTASANFPDVPPFNFIDRHVLGALQRLRLFPADLADDATFLRRASLDVAGELPTPGEVRAFLADRSADKREKKIEELLARPGHAALWTLKFCDLLKASDYGVYADGLRQEADAPRFQAWIRARLEENIPYDELVERILTATSREGRDVETWSREVVALEEGYGPGRKDLEVYRRRRTLDLFWQRRTATGVDAALQIAHAFLGLRLECAQCHRHPHDVWQQEDLLAFANFFVRVRKVGFQGDNEKKFPEAAVVFKRLEAEGKSLAEQAKKYRVGEYRKLESQARSAKNDPAARERFEAGKRQLAALERRSRALPEAARRLLHAEVRLLEPGKVFATVQSPLGKQTSQRYRLPGQAEDAVIPPGTDPRQIVVDWMRRADNPFFARAIVNRVWAHYLGRGLIDPPDDLSPFNPPSHPELLDELAGGFIRSGFDLRWLHRVILRSRTYQQSSQAHPGSAFDQVHYTRFGYRRLPAEVLLDALDRATGTQEKMEMEYYHWPARLRAVEVPYMPRNAFVAFVLEQFGRPKRNSAVQCDCERDSNVSVLQVLSLANHPRIGQKIADGSGRVAQVLRDFDDEQCRVEELFLAALGRLPTAAEQQACREHLAASTSPAKGLQEVLWSLINTREFLLQH